MLGLALGCGARTGVGSAPADDNLDATSSSDGANRDSPLSPCAAGGVRLCGGSCPSLSPPECPGYGCTQVLDRTTFTPLGIGVCWADLGDEVQCAACKDGDACVQRAADRLVCVPFAVCEKLASLGAGSACRYADKSGYDGKPLASPTGTCPSAVEAALCGGPCGACPKWTLGCSGRSSTRPFGVCPYTFSGYDSDPRNVEGCSVASDGHWLRPCTLMTILNGPRPMEPARCLIFDVPTLDLEAARRWGLCSPQSVCKGAAIQGSVHCYRSDGFDDR